MLRSLQPDNIIKEYEFYDSIDYNCYRSQYPITITSLIKDNSLDIFDYDSISRKISIKNSPIFFCNHIRYKHTTDLTDSIKHITDCYVPFGQKEHYSQLIEYQPFHSIKELPVYYTWKRNAQGIFKFLFTEDIWMVLTIIGLCLIQFIFWIVAFSKYRNIYKNILATTILSFFYGIGMTLLATLSFMAFYWSVFNLILPDQIISTLIGSAGCLICLLFVYKNAFGKFWRHLKNLWKDIKTYGLSVIYKKIEHSLTNLPKQLKVSVKQTNERIKKSPEYFKKNRRAILLRGLIVIALGTTILLYTNGYNKRKYYITELNKIIERGEYARANGIVQELIDQHSWFLYPNLSKNLNSLKKKIPSEKIIPSRRITPELLNSIAKKQNTSLDCSDISDLLAFSEDASKLVIRVEYPKRNDLQDNLYQVILLDLNQQVIDTLTPKSKLSWAYEYKCRFSPSGEYLIISDEEGQHTFTLKNRTIADVSDQFIYRPDDIIMINDSDFYFTNLGTLYKNSLTSKESPKVINQNKEIWDNLKMISNHLIGCMGGQSEIIIYDTFKDSVCFHSKKISAGDLKYINESYAITTTGLYDLKSDSLIAERGNIFQYKNNIVELKHFEDDSYFCDLKGNRIAMIPSQKDDYINNNIKFNESGNYLINKSSNILIFDLSTNEKLEKKVSERDKKTFDLK